MGKQEQIVEPVEEQLSMTQIAEKLGVNATTVWRWIQRGELKPVRKLGHRIVRVPASAVRRFLEARTI